MKRHIHCHFTNVPSNIWSLVSLATIYNLFYGLPWTVNYTKLYNAPPKVFCITRYLQICLSSVQSLSHVRLFATPRITARQASLSITNNQSTPKLISIELVMPSNLLMLCRPLLLPPIPPSIKVFSNESTLHMRWPKYWSFSFSISLSNEYPGLTSFRMVWLDLLAVQGTLKSLLQHHSSKASILRRSAFSSQSNSHIHTWPQEKPYPWLDGP